MMTAEGKFKSITHQDGPRVAMGHLLCLVAAVVLSINPIRVFTQTASATTVNDSEAYAVYASLFPKNASSLVIQQETITNWGCLPSGPQFEAEWRAVINNFTFENKSARTLGSNQPLGRRYTLVHALDLRAIVRAPDYSWAEFHRKYPESDGYFQVSAVGFNDVRTRALVYTAHHCGPECGRGGHHALEKVDGSWREAHVAGMIQCETGS